ncbi:MAG: acyl-CoA dehydrogenase [Rhizobiales bacterium NRL2]|jgi:acyl-CoA dehydrogenase|nr:MAG: acyl-CoA dehydrogenase [Rhizobiales bacterium NRL2]
MIFRDPVHMTEELGMLRDTVRRFVADEVTGKGDAWEKEGRTPKSVLKKLGDLGVLGVRYPAEYGGSELDTLATVALHEELGRSTYGGFHAMVSVHTDMASPHLARYGTDEQKQKYMPAIIAGDILTAVAVTEPGAGSDVAGISTKAVRDGNGWRLNGRKIFITNGATADVLFVAAKTDSSVKGSRGISIFIVERDTPGFETARTLDKTGWRSSDTAELVFEDARLPADALLGQENRGFYAIMDNFQNERLTLGAACVGMAMAGIEQTLDWVKQRRAFGNPLWDLGAVRQRMAKAAAEVEAARQLTWHAAWLDAQGLDCTREVSMVKALTGDMVNHVLYECTQFFGGMGFMTENPVERMYRDARVMSIGGGASEVMLEEVAKRL